MNEIATLLQEAKAYAQTTGSWIVLPLHSALSIEEQDRVSSTYNLLPPAPPHAHARMHAHTQTHARNTVYSNLSLFQCSHLAAKML